MEKLQAAQVEWREHGDALAPHAAVRDAPAGEQLAQRAQRLRQLDLLAEHRKGEQATGGVTRGVAHLRREDLVDEAGEGRSPRRPRGALGEPRGRARQRPHGRLEAARRAQPGARPLEPLVTFVILGRSVLRADLKLGDAAFERAAPRADPLHPLVAAADDARLARLVQPERDVAGSRRVAAERRGGQQGP